MYIGRASSTTRSARSTVSYPTFVKSKLRDAIARRRWIVGGHSGIEVLPTRTLNMTCRTLVTGLKPLRFCAAALEIEELKASTANSATKFSWMEIPFSHDVGQVGRLTTSFAGDATQIKQLKGDSTYRSQRYWTMQQEAAFRAVGCFYCF